MDKHSNEMSRCLRNTMKSFKVLTAQAYKCLAMVAETFVFVYLGMAVFTFPIFHGTVWLLSLISMLACLVGRLHIYLGSWLTNCARDATTALPPISSTYQFIMWFSGLRGGVAFALAAGIYAEAKFPETCGGAPERGPEHNCVPAMSDGLAMLQATLLIAAMTMANPDARRWFWGMSGPVHTSNCRGAS